MPNVFVVPPEEDDIPSWCCFNAALPLEQQIRRSEDLERDIDVFDPTVAYDDDITAMDAALARRSMETRSIVETLMARDYNIDHAAIDSDSDLEWDSENEQQPHSGGEHQPHSPRRTASTSDVGNDSDVIEVVKVSRRKRDMGELDQYRAPSTGLNRAGTFKERATKALRSFTGTFRSSSSSSKSRVQDNLPPRPSSSMSMQVRKEENKQTLPRPGARMGRRFPQLFTAPSAKSQPLAVSDEQSVPHPAGPSPSEPVMPSRSTSSSVGRSSFVSFETEGRRSSLYQESMTSDTHSRAASPGFSTNSQSKKRFSKLNIQKMFSFSSNSNITPHDEEPFTESAVSGRTTPTLKRKSSSLPSTSSESSGPQTPTSTEESPARLPTIRSTIIYDEDGRSPQFDFGDFDTAGLDILPPSLSSTSQKIQATALSKISTDTTDTFSFTSSPATRKSGLGLDDDAGDGDISFEMRLDSLHFDDISFDADHFRADFN